MSTIRRQSILSSGIVYIGFALGLLNTYLYTRQGGLTQTQYGLIGIFISIANIMFSLSNFGMQAYIYKFYPYYNDNLDKKKSDLVTWALSIAIIGFVFVLIGGLAFKSLVIRKFGAHSEELLQYYYWTFPFGFGLTLYSLLESYAWQLKKSVFTNYLREVQFRAFTTILIVCLFTGIIKNFDTFIKLFSLNYLIIAFTLVLVLIFRKELYLNFSVSRVTRKFRKKIVALAIFIWSGSLLHNIAAVFSPIIIAAVLPKGLATAGVFVLAQYMTSIMQAPQRGIIAASLAPLSKAWKDKDFKKIDLIYQRSSINQLIFSAAIFLLIWLNFKDGILTLHLQEDYLNAQQVFFFLGLNCIIDMGTGLNAQIISTSTFWRFDFITGIILLTISLPLSYVLTKTTGLTGPAIAMLVSFTIYNGIRYFFLLKKFHMQPFTLKTVYTLLCASADFLVCFFLFRSHYGFIWIIIRSTAFIIIYVSCVLYFNLSPDILPVWATFKKKLGIKHT
ncbi:MAG: lipopolysaccharide biosynthesis protein [Bacteroidetes bacterium]|nr:lipopolysaccharide biosynthesis protein [Bacteroidota bacterium]MBS1973835.1 lipopolysaccharide biosynthesis protein [Bacteroidota bacterium]